MNEMNGLMKTIGLIFLLLLISGVGYMGYSGSSRPANAFATTLQAGMGMGNTAVPDTILTPPPTIPVERGIVEDTVIAPGMLAGVTEQVLSAGVGGVLTEMNVRPGDRVKAGQVLAQIERRPYEEALSLARLKLARAEAELARQIANAELAVQSSETSVTGAQANSPSLTAAQIRVQQAQRALAEAQAAVVTAYDPGREWELYIDDPSCLTGEQHPNCTGQPYSDKIKNERAAADSAVGYATDNLALAQAELAGVQNQSWANSQHVTAAQIGVEKSQMELDTLRQEGVDPLLQWGVDKAQADLDATTVTAPFDGVVSEVNVRAGENVGTGQSLLVLADVRQGELVASVIEEDLPLVQAGHKAAIYFDAAPDAIVNGTVDRIVPRRTGTDRPLYPVYIRIPEVPENLLPGMTADAIIIIDRRESVLRLPRALVRVNSDNMATVEVWNGRAAELREVEIGLRGDAYVEILSGLAEGELVVGR
jgi:RND family efflux transporter MFP subunit